MAYLCWGFEVAKFLMAGYSIKFFQGRKIQSDIFSSKQIHQVIQN